MKKSIFIIALIVLVSVLLSFFASCAGKYSEIKSTEDELRVVGNIKEYNIFYDELRCSVMNAKSLMSTYYGGIDWSDTESCGSYIEELETRVFEGLKFNYAVQILFAEAGYTIEHESIQSAVQTQIEKLIDECGSRKKYIEYLNENYLTDRLLRFNIAISYALNELLYVLNDNGAFDEYVDFDFTAITMGDIYFDIEAYGKAMDLLYSGEMLLYAEYLYVKKEMTDAESLADDMYVQALNGKAFADIAKEFSDKVSNDSLYLVEGEFDKGFYSSVKSIEANGITLYKGDSGYYVIQRLEVEPEYINYNYYDLIYTYLSIKENEHIEEYAKTLELTLTEFGKSISLTDMN